MMSFIVSGQPKLGHESWPPPVDDKVLSDRLYGQRGAKDKTRMEIKFEKIGGRLIAYYHFSKLKDVTSCLTDEEKKRNPPADHGRKGSFFVMSLRMDGCYSTDFSEIYTLLEKMYKKHVDGKVLKMSKGGYLVYQIMKLEDAKEIWKSITSELEASGENTFLERTKSIPGDISIKGTKTSDYFSVEDAKEKIEDALINKGGVFVLTPDEMKARNERIKQQEKRTDDEIPSGKRIDEQELIYTTGNNISQEIKKTSLSEKSKTINERINAVGGRFQVPSQKKDLNIRKWFLFALAVLGIINVWLFVSVINMNGKVNTLVVQFKSLKEKLQSTSYVPNTTCIDKTIASEGGGVNDTIVGQEELRVTFLDLRLSDGTSVSTMKKKNSYVVTAKTSQPTETRGTGKYVCDIKKEDGSYKQKGNKCYITISDSVTVDSITLKYRYRFGNKDTLFHRVIKIVK